MRLKQRNLVADVEAIRIKSQLRNFLGDGVEEVASIEGVVAIEFPGGGMQLIGSGLDHRGDGGGPSETILRAVVGSQVAEFGDRVQGRHDASAASATVEVFAAIEQLEVVSRPLTVDADVAVTADRGGSYEVPLDAGCARRQGEQRVYAPPIGSELSNLLTGDDATDLAGIRLHRHDVGLDGDFLLRRAHLHHEVDASAVVDVQYDSVLLLDAEAGGFGGDVVVTDGQTGDDVLAVAIGNASADHASLKVSKSDRHIGDHRARGIGDGPDDSGFLAVGVERQTSQQHAEDKEMANANAFYSLDEPRSPGTEIVIH